MGDRRQGWPSPNCTQFGLGERSEQETPPWAFGLEQMRAVCFLRAVREGFLVRSAPIRAPESAREQRGVSPLQAGALWLVTENNCAVERQCGEQLEVNGQSAG